MKPSLSSETVEARYLVDKEGNKTDIVLSIDLFNALLQELEDLYDITEAEKIIKKKGKRYTLEEVEKMLAKKD